MRPSDVPLAFYLACIGACSIHLLLLEYRKLWLPKSFRKPTSLRILPIASLCLSVVVVATSTTSKRGGSPQCADDEEVNSDIGGIGVLLGLFSPSLALVILLVLGHKKAETSGVKELCLAHMANLLYLSVNLAKSMTQLSRQETLVAYSTIDAIIASITMAISDKDVIAARKILFLGISLQVIAFIIEGVLISRLSRFDPLCLSGVVHPVLRSSRPIIWAFWIIRLLAAFAPVPAIYRIAPRLHELEHAPREGLQVKEAKIWSSFPATLFTNYLVHFSIVFLQGMPAFFTIQATLSRSWTMLWSEWGQSAALIVAMVAIGHTGFSFSRLFGTEAVQHRIDICVAANPVPTWVHEWSPELSIFSWKGFLLRSPFGKLSLSIGDELFVDDAMLHTYAEDLPRLSDTERKSLWEGLVAAFNLNDKIGIRDCLDRGAPIDWRDLDGSKEYPVHMAARFGDVEILNRTLGTHLPRPYDRLLSKNDSGDTPLQVAFIADKFGTTRALLAACLQGPFDPVDLQAIARRDISLLLKRAIDAERISVLKAIADMVPEWDSNLLGDEHSSSRNAFMFAVERNKIKSARLILERLSRPISFPKEDLRLFRYEETLQRKLIQHFPEVLVDDYTTYVEDAPYFSLSLVLRKTLNFKNELLCTDLLSSRLSLPDHFLDSALTCFHLGTESLRNSLANRGARDWSQFVDNIRMRKPREVQQCIMAEAKNGHCVRMLNVMMSEGHLPLSWIIQHWTKAVHPGTICRIIESALQHGAYAFPLHLGAHQHSPLQGAYASQKYHDRPTSLLLLDAASCEDRQKPESKVVLWAMCEYVSDSYTGQQAVWCLQGVEFLLKKGARTDVERGRGVTPRSAIQKPWRPFRNHAQVKVWTDQLLTRWEDYQKGVRPNPPTSEEHPEWKSVEDDEEGYVAPDFLGRTEDKWLFDTPPEDLLGPKPPS